MSHGILAAMCGAMIAMCYAQLTVQAAADVPGLHDSRHLLVDSKKRARPRLSSTLRVA